MATIPPKNAIIPRVTGAFSSTTVNPGKTVTFTWTCTRTSTARLYLTGSGIDFVPSYALEGSRVLTVPMGAKVGTKIRVNWLATSPTGGIITGSATTTVVAMPISANTVIYPTVSLNTTPDPNLLLPKQSAVISWKSSDTTKLTLTAPGWTAAGSNAMGNLGANTLSGNITAIAPEMPAMYNIKVSATSPTGLVKDFNFPVQVTAPPVPKPNPVVPIITGVFTPNTATVGGNSVLTWSTSNVTSMIMSSTDITFRANTISGNADVGVPSTFAGSKIVINYTAGTADAQQKSGSFVLPITAANLALPPGPPKVTFTIAPEYNPNTKPIAAGAPFTISWFSSNANTVTLAGLGLNTNQLTGILDLIAPPTPGTYYISVNAVGPGGTNNNTEIFQVGAANIAPPVPVADPVIQMSFTPNAVNMGANTTLTWNVTGANTAILNSPPQLSIYSNAVSGSRTISAPNVAGVYTSTITVPTANGTPKSAQATLTVINPVALRIQPQVITLPDCRVKTPYSYSYSASGGLPPYKFAVVLGLLPYGLKLNPTTGTISGTPILTKVKVASFTISVTDSLKKTDRLDGSIKIK